MPRYETHLIADFKTGYSTAKEPWMSPQDAFPVLLDARVDRGYLQKRAGYIELADTGAGYPIMGLHSYMRKGHPSHLVVDRKRLYRYRPYSKTLVDVSGSDMFTGSDKDFFWFQTWRDKCYFCNSVDAIYEYDEIADTLAAIDTISDAATDISIDSCVMIFRFKSRLIFISPTIDGVWYPRRAVYTEVNLTQVKATNFVNGDIEDVPVSGCYINGQPTIFGHEGFIARIKYTFDTDTPFAWEEVDKGLGVLGPRQAPVFNKTAIQLSHAGLMTWDGYKTAAVGPQIRDFVAEVDNFQAWYLQATLRRDKHIMYMAYPNDGQTANDRILEFNLDEGNFAVHRIAAHVLLGVTGHIAAEVSLIKDHIGAPSGSSGIGYHDLTILRHPDYKAMVLIGGHTGKLMLMNYGTTDAGTAISPEVWTAAFNPYYMQGRKVKFGKCRVLVTTSATETCTVSFYKDLSSTPYKTATLAADGEGGKHWVTLFPDGEVGNFHQMAFTGGLPEIHAIELTMAAAGKLDAGGADSVVTVDATTTSATVWRFVQKDDSSLELQKYVSGAWVKNVKWDD